MNGQIRCARIALAADFTKVRHLSGVTAHMNGQIAHRTATLSADAAQNHLLVLIVNAQRARSVLVRPHVHHQMIGMLHPFAAYRTLVNRLLQIVLVVGDNVPVQVQLIEEPLATLRAQMRSRIRMALLVFDVDVQAIEFFVAMLAEVHFAVRFHVNAQQGLSRIHFGAFDAFVRSERGLKKMSHESGFESSSGLGRVRVWIT